MIDSPMNGYAGGTVAAPVFKRIAGRIYGIMQRRTADFSNDDVKLVSNYSSGSSKGYTRKANDEGWNVKAVSVQANSDITAVGMVRVPDVSFLDYASAAAILENYGLVASNQGESDLIVQSEKPLAGTVIPKGSSVQLNFVDAKHITKLPDFRGASIRKATSFLLSAGIPFHVVGSGRIISEYPKAGEAINKNVDVIINCDNKDFDISGLRK
jgi:hypothetical protein